MSKIFDFIDMILGFFQWIFDFFTQMWSLITRAVPIIASMIDFAFVHVPVLSYFFTLFLSISILLFVWRLIP